MPQFSQIECSSCGRITAHLVPVYYQMLINLKDLHQQILDKTLSVDSVDASKFETGLDYPKNIWDSYLKRYYEGMDANVYSPEGLVANALLMHTELEMPINESGFFVPRYCCKRMLLCDNSSATY